MGFGFRKSKKIGPVRVTLSKSGIGASIGVKGARVGIGADGRKNVTLSVPGTGLSYRETSGSERTHDEPEHPAEVQQHNVGDDDELPLDPLPGPLSGLSTKTVVIAGVIGVLILMSIVRQVIRSLTGH
jgi:hypothetical protein